jgi:hypothetical protein
VLRGDVVLDAASPLRVFRSMVRAILYAVLSLFVIAFVRVAMQIIMKGFGDAIREENPAAESRPATGKTATSGELKGCKVCGTYVLASAAKTSADGGETLYYCSEECKRKG